MLNAGLLFLAGLCFGLEGKGTQQMDIRTKDQRVTSLEVQARRPGARQKGEVKTIFCCYLQAGNPEQAATRADALPQLWVICLDYPKHPT